MFQIPVLHFLCAAFRYREGKDTRSVCISDVKKFLRLAVSLNGASWSIYAVHIRKTLYGSS